MEIDSDEAAAYGIDLNGDDQPNFGRRSITATKAKRQPAHSPDTEWLDAKPASDQAAEMAIAGAVVLGDQLLPAILAEGLRPEEFYDPAGRVVFSAAIALHADGITPTLAMLQSMLSSRGDWESLGLGAYLFEAMEKAAVGEASARRFATSIKDRHQRRMVREWLATMQANLLSTMPTPELIAQAGQALDEVRGQAIASKPRFVGLTCAELCKADLQITYAIEGMLAEGMPCILAGPKKALKTTLLLAMSLSLAIGRAFLGRFWVLRPYRVVILTGESGLPTVRETLLRQAYAEQIDLATVEGLIICDTIPQLADDAQLAELKQFLEKHQAEVVAIDPAYLAMDGADAGNLFVQGAQLRRISELCQSIGATLVLAHHTRKGVADPSQPPELEDIAWSGFQEFARQWLLVGRRTPYDPGSGEHRLWLTAGGSAGHSSAWALDISEGVYDGKTPRHWSVDVFKASEARDAVKEEKNKKKDEATSEKLEQDKKRILQVVAKLGDKYATQSQIRERTGRRGQAFSIAFAELVEDGSLVVVPVVQGNNRTYDGYKLGGETSA